MGISKKLLLESVTDDKFFIGKGRVAGFRTSKPEGLPEGYTRNMALIVFVSKDSDGVIFPTDGPEMVEGEIVIFTERRWVSNNEGLSIDHMRIYMGREDFWDEVAVHPI